MRICPRPPAGTQGAGLGGGAGRGTCSTLACVVLYVSSCLNSGQGQRRTRTHTLSRVMLNRQPQRGKQTPRRHPWVGVGAGTGGGAVEGEDGSCCQATGRGICSCLFSPLHPVPWVTATHSWASRSQSWVQLQPTCQMSSPEPFPSLSGGLPKPHSVLSVRSSPGCPCVRDGSPELHPGTRPWLYLLFPGNHLGHKSHQIEAFCEDPQ